jgi:O-succinylbenzoate synthase
MKIKNAEIFKIRLPLISPFRTGFGEIKERILVWLKLNDETGLTGYGESANLEEPIYETEYNDATILLLKKILVPRLIGKNIESIDQLIKTFTDIKGNNFAKAALDAAFWHIEMQKKNKPLWQLWGGVKLKIPVAISIGLDVDLQSSIKKVFSYIEKYSPKRAKIKIKPGIDIKLIAAIRKKYPKLPIMVDANASYTLKDVEIFKKLDQFNLIMIEQPLSFDDLVDHSLLQKEIKTPICLDESIKSLHDAEQAVRIGACKIINIKPQRVGGYWQAKKIARFCQKHNIPVWCGGMIESGWGQLFNSSIATLPNFKYENDICLTKWYLKDDILESPIAETNGHINVANLSFNINFKKLNKFKKEIIKIT